MRHNKAINHLGRQSGHRKAMLANMASSLILQKDDSTHSRRVVFSYLKDKNAVAELFRTIAPKVADRPGGYTRVLHTGFRQGDAAEMALIEFVDFNEAALASAPKAEKKATRRSRAKKAEAPTQAEAAPAAEQKAEE